jgi:hypothetical protein
MNAYTAEKHTASWLKQNGLKAASFMVMDLVCVQAQQIAHNLLKYHLALLTAAEIALLNSYLLKANNKAKQKTLTHKQAYQVMNLGKRINRKVFVAYKTINSR